MNSISGQESNIKYLEIYENSNKTSKPQGRTLSTIAGDCTEQEEIITLNNRINKIWIDLTLNLMILDVFNF